MIGVISSPGDESHHTEEALGAWHIHTHTGYEGKFGYDLKLEWFISQHNQRCAVWSQTPEAHPCVSFWSRRIRPPQRASMSRGWSHIHHQYSTTGAAERSGRKRTRSQHLLPRAPGKRRPLPVGQKNKRKSIWIQSTYCIMCSFTSPSFTPPNWETTFQKWTLQDARGIHTVI